MKTMRRDTLKKKVEAGKMEAKCNHHYTDDYAYDNAVNFGETDWMPAHIMHPTYKEVTLQNGNKMTVRDDEDRKAGFFNLMNCDFTGNGGHAWLAEDGTICLYVHSNLSYQLREVVK